MQVGRWKHVLVALVGTALAACSGASPMSVSAPDGGADAPGRAEVDAPAADAPPVVGPVNVQALDRLGRPLTGADVVIHDSAGHPVAHVTTDALGQASGTIVGSGGVSLVDGVIIVTALGVGPGQTVVLRSSRYPSGLQFIQLTPRLPPLPPDWSAPSYSIDVVALRPGGSFGGSTADILVPPVVNVFGDLLPDGHYAIEAQVRSTQGSGPSLYTSVTDIPAADLAPALPPWRSQTDFFSLVRRRPASPGWGLSAGLLIDGSESTLMQLSTEGDGLYVEAPTPLAGDLVLKGFFGGNGEFAVTYVDVHDVPPIADHGTIDFEAERPRAPHFGRLVSDKPFTVVWDESGPGIPARFVLAELDWDTDPSTSGSWSVLVPEGDRRIVFPELPAELASSAPPTEAMGAFLSVKLNLFDDTSVASYGDLLAADLLAELAFSPRQRSADAVLRQSSIWFASVRPDPWRAPVFTLVSDPPPASDGRVHLTAGQTLRVTAEVDGAPYPKVTWTVSPARTPPDIEGATVTVTGDAAGQAIFVGATSKEDSLYTNEIVGEVDPPDCMKTWPALRPTRVGASLLSYVRIPIAVRRDGSPVVAAYMMGQFNVDPTINVVAWDGLDWNDVAEPIALARTPFFQFSDSPLALVVDDQDRPVLAFEGDDGIEVRRVENGAWHALGGPFSAFVQGDMVLALDAAGNPLIATTTGTSYDPSPVTVWRWNGTAWTSRVAFAGVPTSTVNVRSLVMDGDVPVVSFDYDDSVTVRARVVRVDDEAIDLGNFDDDATVFGYPRPLLALPRPDQPLVAWIDPASVGSGSDLVVRVSQRTVTGWEPVGVPLPLPAPIPSFDRQPPHAILWNDASHRAVVATQETNPIVAITGVEVRSVDDGARVCAALRDLDASSFGGAAVSIGVALDPNGGTIVAFSSPEDPSHINVERVRP